MDRVNCVDCPKQVEQGCVSQVAFGEGGKIVTDEATMAFVQYSSRHGAAEPCCRGFEALYVVKAQDAFVRYGDFKDMLDRREKLANGDVLLAFDHEWYTFEFDDAEGFVDLIVFSSLINPETCHAGEA